MNTAGEPKQNMKQIDFLLSKTFKSSKIVHSKASYKYGSFSKTFLFIEINEIL